MAKLHLFAHNKENFVQVGDRVTAYETTIASIGTAHWKWWAHLHYSVSEGLTMSQLFAYTRWWTKEKCLKYYLDPRNIDVKKMFFGRAMDVGNKGYDFMDKIAHLYYHPGVDINGFGGGNTDRGYKFNSPVSGVVVYSGDKWGGWGKVVIIKEDEENACNHSCPAHC